MRCPYCGDKENRVLDSRESEEGRAIRRRRHCEGCDRRFTTYERPEASFPAIIKTDGSREAFDRLKILRGLRTACQKRPVSEVDLERLVTEVEGVITDGYEREVASRIIGAEVMKRLKSLDQVAFVRYASVYWDFQRPEDFKGAVDALEGTELGS